jgi:predicted regulator of Ras-like GTPase activity (Roadblock/LC7/MglB family)
LRLPLRRQKGLRFRSSVKPLAVSVQKVCRDVLDNLPKKVPGVQAVILAGVHEVLDCVVVDPSLDIETIASEFATVLRIAGRASEDSGAGNLVEQVVVSEKSTILARSVSVEEFLILVCRRQDQIGRARYELRQAVWEIQRRGNPKRA